MAKSRVSRDVVDVSFSRSIAALAGHCFSSLQPRGVARLGESTVADQPLTLFDLNGQPLFHDYGLVSGAVTVGTIRTAANRRLGSPVISISHTAPGWNPDSALRRARESLHASEATAVVQDWQLVVYAYPKVGIRLNYRVPGKSAVRSQIFDAASGGAVADSRDPDHQFTQYSLLNSLKASEVTKRLKRYAEAEKQIRQLQINRPEMFAATQLATGLSQADIFPFGVQQGLVLLSPYCPNSPIGLTHYSQITNYFCVDASSQMLMEHYGWNYTQNQIAVAMGTSAANGGTTGAGLTSGFASLTHNSLVLSFDGGASRGQQFQDAINEISANRPLFTQVPHHYRVCVGYFENTLDLLFFTLGLNQMIYIYDPWPWNPDLCQGGAIYWETWATSPVMWFGIVQHA
jgi:hypothetical protein